MDAPDLLTAFRSEGERIASTVAGRDLGVRVPYCDGLDVAEVVRHLGSIYHRIAGWITTQRAPARWERVPPGETDVLSWYAAAMRALHERLAAHGEDEPCDTGFAGDRTYHFWRRRMAHETTVHRMDVAEAYGLRYPVGDAVAVDGIDEVLTFWLGSKLGSDVRGDGQVVALEAGPRVWQVTLLPDTVDVAAEIPWECDVAVSGGPEHVYRWLWGRGGLDVLHVTGDASVAAVLRETMARATQSPTPSPGT